MRDLVAILNHHLTTKLFVLSKSLIPHIMLYHRLHLCATMVPRMVTLIEVALVHTEVIGIQEVANQSIIVQV